MRRGIRCLPRLGYLAPHPALDTALAKPDLWETFWYPYSGSVTRHSIDGESAIAGRFVGSSAPDGSAVHLSAAEGARLAASSKRLHSHNNLNSAGEAMRAESAAAVGRHPGFSQHHSENLSRDSSPKEA
jgi:hypothetical protein